MFEALKPVLILWGLQHQEDLYNVDNNLKFYRYDKIRLSVLIELRKLQSFQSTYFSCISAPSPPSSI
jgi:hypothetical protein